MVPHRACTEVSRAVVGVVDLRWAGPSVTDLPGAEVVEAVVFRRSVVGLVVED